MGHGSYIPRDRSLAFDIGPDPGRVALNLNNAVRRIRAHIYG
jgi:hypothetical protein